MQMSEHHNILITLQRPCPPEEIDQALRDAGIDAQPAQRAGSAADGILLTDYCLAMLWDSATGADQCHPPCPDPDQRHTPWRHLTHQQRHHFAVQTAAFLSNEIANTFAARLAMDDAPGEAFAGIASAPHPVAPNP